MSKEDEQISDGLVIRPHWLAMVQEILRQHVPDREVRAFGSRATGASRPFSDLDIAICGAEPVDDLTMFALRDALEESDLPINVDVAPVQSAGPHIVDAVARHGIVIQSGSPAAEDGGRPQQQDKAE